MLSLILILFSALFFCSNNLQGAAYWVAKTGNSNNTCTQAQSESTPKLTITSALSCLSAGDTIIVKAGVYSDSFPNTIPGGTSWNAPVTLRANSGDVVTIRPPLGADGVFAFTNPSKQYIIIRGFVLDGVNETQGHGFYISSGANHLRVQDCEIKNMWNNGVLISASGGPADFNEFINLDVHDNGTNPDLTTKSLKHGFYIATDNNLVDRCKVYNNPGHGLQLYSAFANQPDNNTVRNSLFHHNGSKGLGSYNGSGNQVYNNVVYSDGGSNGAGITCGTPGMLVYNNTVYDAPQLGIYVSANNVVLRNNIVYQAHVYGIYVGPGVSGTVVQNNLSSGGLRSNFRDEGSGTTASNNFFGSLDPRFVNIANKDFHIQARSPAIDSGTRVVEVTSDIEGNTRPRGLAYDLGAYEYLGGSATSLLPPPTNVKVF